MLSLASLASDTDLPDLWKSFNDWFIRHVTKYAKGQKKGGTEMTHGCGSMRLKT